MHNVLSSLNDYTSEIFMIFREVTSASVNQKTQLYRRIKFYLDIIIDLCRVLELLSRHVPEIFLTRNQLHATRLFDYILFVLRSVFTMKMDKLFVDFCDKIKTRSRSLPQFLAPFIGILVNLYRKLPRDLGASLSGLDNLQSLFNRMDSFDPKLFHNCYQTVYVKLPPTNDEERTYFAQFEQMMAEIDILVQSKQIRKDSIDSTGASIEMVSNSQEESKEPEIDDELLCKICFNRQIDTSY